MGAVPLPDNVGPLPATLEPCLVLLPVTPSSLVDVVVEFAPALDEAITEGETFLLFSVTPLKNEDRITENKTNFTN